eukprot:1330244-Rhodomonas_salina.3
MAEVLAYNGVGADTCSGVGVHQREICSVGRSEVLDLPIGLRACYAMSGTELATEPAYGAVRCAVLSERLAVPAKGRETDSMQILAEVPLACPIVLRAKCYFPTRLTLFSYAPCPIGVRNAGTSGTAPAHAGLAVPGGVYAIGGGAEARGGQGERPRCSPGLPILLRAPYVMSGTDLAYGGILPAPMSGTDRAYAATRL